LYPLEEVFTITICGVLCGANNWVEVAEYGRAKQEFLSQFLELKKGVPSHDTFGDIFSSLDTNKFEECFVSWTGSICKEIPELIAIDGKVIRGSKEPGNDKKAICLVSAWAGKQEIVLGQKKTAEKSNEITAIPKLLELLTLKGAIVTIDAAGCQKNIASQIISKEGDYVLALKGNQGNLLEDVSLFLKDHNKKDSKNESSDFHKTIDSAHGRIETRRYFITSDISWLSQKEEWKNLTSIGMVESEVRRGGQISKDTRYYISSLLPNASLFAEAVRGHWGIENKLHWSLDVTFQDDLCRIRKNNAPANFTIIKQIAMNLFKKDTTVKKSLNIKRHLAGWKESYLKKLIGIT